MEPETGQLLTEAVDIAEAFSEMTAGSEFLFNGRRESLLVLNREAGERRTFARIADRENSALHTFHWSEELDRPRHKPHEMQTNFVEELLVLRYSRAEQATF